MKQLYTPEQSVDTGYSHHQCYTYSMCVSACEKGSCFQEFINSYCFNQQLWKVYSKMLVENCITQSTTKFRHFPMNNTIKISTDSHIATFQQLF